MLYQGEARCGYQSVTSDLFDSAGQSGKMLSYVYIKLLHMLGFSLPVFNIIIAFITNVHFYKLRRKTCWQTQWQLISLKQASRLREEINIQGNIMTPWDSEVLRFPWAWCLHCSADFFRTQSSVSTCDVLLVDGRINERHSRLGQHWFPFVVGPYRPFWLRSNVLQSCHQEHNKIAH